MFSNVHVAHPVARQYRAQIRAGFKGRNATDAMAAADAKRLRKAKKRALEADRIAQRARAEFVDFCDRLEFKRAL